MPNPKFPIYILKNGLKITNEKPRGVKANLLEIYSTLNEE